MVAHPTLRKVTRADGTWEIRADDLASLIDHLGQDLFLAFASSYVHADRLAALSHVGAIAAQRFATEPIANKRQFSALLLFSIGTLRELAKVLPRLRSRLRQEGMSPHSWPRQLQAVEDLWEKTRRNVDLRNKLAFHVDAKIFRKGVEELAAMGPQTLFEGDSDFERGTWFSLGHFALFQGIGLAPDELSEIASQVSTHLILTPALDELLTHALRRDWPQRSGE